jgi:hypothetical protein
MPAKRKFVAWRARDGKSGTSIPLTLCFPESTKVCADFFPLPLWAQRGPCASAILFPPPAELGTYTLRFRTLDITGNVAHSTQGQAARRREQMKSEV